jgi:hypothetical protein
MHYNRSHKILANPHANPRDSRWRRGSCLEPRRDRLTFKLTHTGGVVRQSISIDARTSVLSAASRMIHRMSTRPSAQLSGRADVTTASTWIASPEPPCGGTCCSSIEPVNAGFVEQAERMPQRFVGFLNGSFQTIEIDCPLPQVRFESS